MQSVSDDDVWKRLLEKRAVLVQGMAAHLMSTFIRQTGRNNTERKEKRNTQVTQPPPQ